ncbi:hypothetical protein [Pandoravirus japonicus]|uniref:Uncharacterized protein n=1 Tax=Pandoravirus japonicus TaxID=2823154 RepID=A0A811BR73_9VIRU|nr:hypothetical protein [Pandoravirus japonicus]
MAASDVIAANRQEQPTAAERPPIDLVPNEVLARVVDRFLDNLSLGACLLAWRRFHAVGERALHRRKYRLATLAAVCTAGDLAGVDHVLAHPEVFGALASGRFDVALRAAAAHGHGAVVRRLARAGGSLWPTGPEAWTDLVYALIYAAGTGAPDDTLVWLCRPTNRPAEWDPVCLKTACIRALGSGVSVERVAAIFDALCVAAGVRADPPRHGWDSCVPTRPSDGDIEAAIAARGEDAMRKIGHDELDAMLWDVRDGRTFALLRRLVDASRLVRALRVQPAANIGTLIRSVDADDARWIYEQFRSRAAFDRFPLLMSLAQRAASAGRLDLTDAVKSDMASFATELSRLTSGAWGGDALAGAVWTVALDAAAKAGHALVVDHILDCPIDTNSLIQAWTLYGHTTAMSSSKVWLGNMDVVRLLLDRRARPDVAQGDIDKRVDATVRLVVTEALARGLLSVVRFVAAREPRLVDETVASLRANDDLGPAPNPWG